jgi:hypothetical protein
VVLADGREVSSHVLLLATGVQYRRLDIPGADKLTGRGIYYGAALVEAAACKDEDVFIVGGANSAGQAALHFAKFACKVTMLVRAGSLEASMSKYLIDEIERTSNIVVEPNTQVLAAQGEDHLEALRIRGPEGESCRPAASLFVFIGAGYGVVTGFYFAGRKRVRACRPGFDRPGSTAFGSYESGEENRWQVCGNLERKARSVSIGEQRARHFRSRGRAARICQARSFGGRRGLDRGAVRAPVSGQFLTGGELRLGK